MSETVPDPIRALKVAASEIQRIQPDPTHQLALYLVQSVERYLTYAQTARQLKDGRDLAAVFALYFKRHRAALCDANALRAMQLRTDRRLGTMLAGIERAPAGRPPGNSLPRVTNFQSTLDELSISPKTAFFWQRLAEIEDQEFETWLSEAQQDGRELTTGSALEFWRQHYYIPPAPSTEDEIPAGAPPIPEEPDDDGYDLANYGSSLMQTVQEDLTTFDEIMSLTAEPAVIERCKDRIAKIKEICLEMNRGS